jgi:hypothetical protein
MFGAASWRAIANEMLREKRLCVVDNMMRVRDFGEVKLAFEELKLCDC